MSDQLFVPAGFSAGGWNVGIKDTTLDFGVVASDRPAAAAAIFTRNNFPGNPIIVGREHVANGQLQAFVVNSKNSNVATGEAGLKIAREMCRLSAENLQITPELILPSSTGVIGRLPPMDRLAKGCSAITEHISPSGFPQFARAIMTTDTREKISSRRLNSGISIIAMAKGAGMIEPNMATMLAYAATDATIDPADLKRLLSTVANRSFNRVSIDSDTSTSDTFAIMANGATGVTIHFPQAAMDYFNTHWQIENQQPDLSGLLDHNSIEFFYALLDLSIYLAREIARDGEGATRLIELTVESARDREQAVKIGRSIINSPLVKTAIYGKDPNWGRLVMAVGKVFDEPIPIENLRIRFGDLTLNDSGPEELKKISEYLGNPEVRIVISLGTGNTAERFWTCDFTEEYIKINAYYTT